jgi:7 transmembrane helices usually fused to an inactive transglutaminase
MNVVETRNGIPRHESSWLLTALLLVPTAIIIGKLPIFPTSRWLNQVLSLSDLSPKLQVHTEFVLFVPLSAIVVCLFRLTLGLPVLSLFRPILTALAFRIVGIPLGLGFLVAVLAGVVLIKPLLKEAHYYVRVPLVLSLAAACVLVPLLLDKWWHAQTLRHLAYFPLINLALICEAFTKILNDKGLRAAMWPTINAVAAAIVITLLAGIPGAMHLLLSYPEVLILQGGVVLMIGKYLDLQLFADRNPFMPKPLAAAHTQQVPSPTTELRVAGE